MVVFLKVGLSSGPLIKTMRQPPKISETGYCGDVTNSIAKEKFNDTKLRQLGPLDS